MSDTAKKQVRKLKIIEDDPNLSAFESDLNERVRFTASGRRVRRPCT